MGQVYIVGKVSSRPIRPFNIASFLTRALNHPFLTRVVNYMEAHSVTLQIRNLEFRIQRQREARSSAA